MPLHNQYASNLKAAKDYEDFVFDTLMHEKKLVCGGFKSKHYQCLYGESMTGVEVKHDLKFRKYGNLFIETQERGNQFEDMKPAGIYHAAAPWLIVIGDYECFWVIATQTLKLIHETGVCREVGNDTNTARGFLLPVCEADRNAAYKWET